MRTKFVFRRHVNNLNDKPRWEVLAIGLERVIGVVSYCPERGCFVFKNIQHDATLNSVHMTAIARFLSNAKKGEIEKDGSDGK